MSNAKPLSFLFRGRFKSILVEEKRYLLTLNRYIHLNPVVARMIKKPEQYIWSSYFSYLNPRKAPYWLMIEYTLNKFGSKLQRKKYKAFVEEGIHGCKKASDIIFNKIKRVPILGSEAFIKTITEKYLTDTNNNINSITLKQREPHKADFIIKAVADYYQVEINSIKTINRYATGNKPRAVAIYLSCLFSNQKFDELATEFSNISCDGISKAYHRTKKKIAKDARLARDAATIMQKYCVS